MELNPDDFDLVVAIEKGGERGELVPALVYSADDLTDDMIFLAMLGVVQNYGKRIGATVMVARSRDLTTAPPATPFGFPVKKGKRRGD